MTAFGQYEDDDSGSTCKQRDYKDATDLIIQPVTQLPIGLDEEQNAVVDGFGTLKARMLGGGFEGTVAVCATGPVTHNLDCAHGATEDDTGRRTPIVPAIAFHPTPLGDSLDPISSVEVTHALGTGSKGGCASAAVATEITGTLSSRATAAGGLGTDFEVAGGLRPEGPMAVRRLLPVECERLQGFPDDWTNIPWRGKPAPDGPRYKAMGNSFAVPVVRWIGQRLDAIARKQHG
jgi:DNA (cytosine-5)-methyltransferase 1